jgi:hypothetical protein
MPSGRRWIIIRLPPTNSPIDGEDRRFHANVRPAQPREDRQLLLADTVEIRDDVVPGLFADHLHGDAGRGHDASAFPAWEAVSGWVG